MVSLISLTCDAKKSVSKSDGYMEYVNGEMGSNGMDIIDTINVSSGVECLEKSYGEMGTSGSTCLDAKTVLKEEDCLSIDVHRQNICKEEDCVSIDVEDKSKETLVNSLNLHRDGVQPGFVNGEMGSNGTYNVDVVNVLEGVEQMEKGKCEIGLSGSISLDAKSVSKEEDYRTIADGGHCEGGTASIDANGEASKKKKSKKKKKKQNVGIMLNPHDGIDDYEMARFLFENLSMGNEEILGDQNHLKDFFNMQPIRTHVSTSKKRLLILDVNGLLADIIDPPPKNCKADINILRRAIFKRPYLDGFLEFCFERFDVAIWSSRTRKILNRVVDYLLGDFKKRLLFLWDVSHCTNSSARSLENKYKCIVFKELRKVWEESDPVDSDYVYYNESNTLLLDDSPYKALLNPKHSGIFPSSYSYKDINDNSLGPDGDLRVYLEGVTAAENVKMYVEEHPFGQHAIDETNPDWSFYAEALKDVS
uniref:uncharacterized protein LOC122579716 n=1 Tax=Erigeron canadensis TaxID=72917 RepID=UPI001CB97C2E|nr:uncharacterized protein LOC122579716 [Erigeron canadensis]